MARMEDLARMARLEVSFANKKTSKNDHLHFEQGKKHVKQKMYIYNIYIYKLYMHTMVERKHQACISFGMSWHVWAFCCTC